METWHFLIHFFKLVSSIIVIVSFIALKDLFKAMKYLVPKFTSSDLRMKYVPKALPIAGLCLNCGAGINSPPIDIFRPFNLHVQMHRVVSVYLQVCF